MAVGRIRKVLVGLVCACVVGAGLLASTAAGAAEDVSVPGVVDVRLDRAAKTLKKAGLKVSHHDAVKNKQRSRWVKSNWVVITQEPPPGATVPSGSSIRLGLRHKNDMSWPGQPPVPVPDVVGMRLDKANKTLRKAFLRTEAFDDVRTDQPRKQKNKRNWTVISQDPQPGAMTTGGATLRVGVRHKKDRIEAPPAPPAPSPAPVQSTPPTPTPVAPAAAGLPPGDDAVVSRVVDGDTIEVVGGTRIRFIGIDTPETSGRAGCFGAEATGHTSQLLPSGTKVRLVYDVERTDRYGRTLAYLYRTSDGLFVNLTLAQEGFAQQLTVPPNVAHAEEFRQAVAQARAADRGLWRACQTAAAPSTPAAAPSTVPQPARPASATPAGGCHPSYRGACVPVAEDVDCAGGPGNGPAYVAEKDFQVVGPDEYGLDGNSNGIACESRR